MIEFNDGAKSAEFKIKSRLTAAMASGKSRIIANGSAAKKLAIMHLKPKLVPHLAKQGLEWADVVPVLEEVDSIDELKEAIKHPMAFLDRISKAGAESLGIAISAGLHVLRVVPGGQGARNNVQAGDIISRVGSIDLSYDGSTQMDVEVGSLLNQARMRGEAFVMIEFNDGAKSAEFKIKSRLTAAMASGKSRIIASGTAAKKLAIMHLKPRLEPYLQAQGLEWADVVPVLETIDSIEELRAAFDDPEALLEWVLGTGFGLVFQPVNEDSSADAKQLPSPSEHVYKPFRDGLTVAEEREQEKAAATRQTMNPTLEEESATLVGVASPTPTKATTRPIDTSAAVDRDSGFCVEYRCPSPVDNAIEYERTVEEQREQECRQQTKNMVAPLFAEINEEVGNAIEYERTVEEQREQERRQQTKNMVAPRFAEISEEGQAKQQQLRRLVKNMASQATGQDGNTPTSASDLEEALTARLLQPLPNQRIQPTLSAPLYGEDIDIDMDSGGGGSIGNV
jgi:hypothetical protein